MNVVPFSACDSDDPEALWDYLQAHEDETGGPVLAIPHNGNLSNGFMFDDVTLAAHDARFFGIEMPDGIAMEVIDRQRRWKCCSDPCYRTMLSS